MTTSNLIGIRMIAGGERIEFFRQVIWKKFN